MFQEIEQIKGPICHAMQTHKNAQDIDMLLVLFPEILEGPQGLPLLPVAFLDCKKAIQKYQNSTEKLNEFQNWFFSVLQQLPGNGDQIMSIACGENFSAYFRDFIYKQCQKTEQKKGANACGIKLGPDFKYAYLEPQYVDGPSVTNIHKLTEQMMGQMAQVPEDEWRQKKELVKQQMLSQGMSEEEANQMIQQFDQQKREMAQQAMMG
eukprot:TRINITY_DN2146_c1_g1_i1.p4 TRINITY_DN2146_c1_g1~~TRINITY_DN2146_c1_g1_i1.p4  ORF type:complete len:208 (-),score=28.34 TRINITY_DN2146_c1_g1_i1:376-999(-)